VGTSCAYEERIYEGVGKYNKLVPIEGGQGVQSQACHAPGNCCELGIPRRNPGDPVEVRQRLDDVVGEPEVDEHSDKTVHEPPDP